MKKIYLLSFALATAVALSSCSKDEKPASSGDDNKVPSTFTKKVLVEEVSGAWCGWCTDGADLLEKILNKYPESAIGVTLHYGDAMAISNYTDLKNAFGITSYPSGIVDRVPSTQDNKVAMNRGYWESNSLTRMKDEASCGLKIDAKSKDAIKVTAAFNKAVSGDVRLTVYAVEDEVTGTGSGYDQQNYLSGRAGYESSPYYTQPKVITGYKHMQVWRAVLNDDTFGDVIPSDKLVAGGVYEQTFNVNTLGWDESKLTIVAFINVKGTTANTHQVLNAQEVKYGSVKNWD